MPDYLPRGDGRSPLANLPEFVATRCPSCGSPAQRETDTMGGFACSSWYFLRFADPSHDAGPFNPEAVRRWLPPDLYVGGAEHAVMHLLYARFWTKVLADAGLIDFREPFPRLASQGILHAPDGKRMCKSAGNVVTPDEVAERFGADILRIYLLFMAPFDRNVLWNEEGIAGPERFLHRLWKVCHACGSQGSNIARTQAGNAMSRDDTLQRATHLTIRSVTADIEGFKFNTAIARLMEFTNLLEDHFRSRDHETGSPASDGERKAIEALILLLSPFAPYIAEELWARRGGTFSVHQQPWPAHEPALAEAKMVTLVIQVNGKVRDRITVPADIEDDEAQLRAMDSPSVQRYLQGRTPSKVIVVPGRLVNVVT
jgi:leucyl-tRNA synthetase